MLITDVYMGEDTRTGEKVAIKVEHREKHSQLRAEARIYRLLQGFPGIPQLKAYFMYAEYNMLAMDLLGPSLEDLHSRCGRRFTLRSTLLVCVFLCLVRPYFFKYTCTYFNLPGMPSRFISLPSARGPVDFHHSAFTQEELCASRYQARKFSHGKAREPGGKPSICYRFWPVKNVLRSKDAAAHSVP